MWTWLERRPVLIDVLAAVVAFALFAGLDDVRTGARTVPVDAAYAVAVGFRRRPGLALAIAWAGAIAQLLLLPSYINGNVLIVAVIAATGLSDRPAVRRAGLASGVVGGIIAGAKLVLISGAFLPRGQPEAQENFSRVIYFLGVSGVVAASLSLFWLLGVAARVRRDFAAERVERLESDRERLRAELLVAQQVERTRITREMHDAIGHSLAVVIAQSDGARYAIAKNPEAASDALAVINRSARSALDDVSALLSVLNGDDEHEGSLGLADIDGLVANMASSGLELGFREVGERVDLPTATDLAVYRIVQESLTNALKHGGPSTSVDVLVTWSPDHVLVQSTTVEPDGHELVAPRSSSAQTRGSGTGYGVAGMVERVRLLGGTVEAGPRTDGERGFQVVARIPIPPRTTTLTNTPTTTPAKGRQ